MLMAVCAAAVHQRRPDRRRCWPRRVSGPVGDAWFGRDIQGYDIYSRTIYGARASILVGVCHLVATVLIGGVHGRASPATTAAGSTSLVSRDHATCSSRSRCCSAASCSCRRSPTTNSPTCIVVARSCSRWSIFGWPRLARLMRQQRHPGQAQRLRPGRPRARGQPRGGSSARTCCPTRWPR